MPFERPRRSPWLAVLLAVGAACRPAPSLPVLAELETQPPLCPTAAELDALPVPAAAPVDGGGLCRDGWCWVNHEPQGHTLNALWAHATGEAWFVGEAGTVLHWKAGAWRWERTPTLANLRGIWGASPTDIWAVGDGGTLLHFDGAAWTATPVPGAGIDLLDVAGVSASEVWAAGKGGLLLRWNGSTWVQVDSGTSEDLRELSLLGADDVWVSAAQTGLRRCTPSGCTAQSGPLADAPTTPPTALWESGGQRWALFAPSRFFVWEGGAWHDADIPEASPGGGWPRNYDAPWVGGAKDVWLAEYREPTPNRAYAYLHHWDGQAWTHLEPPSGSPAVYPGRHASVWDIRRTQGAGPSDLWGFGNEGALLRWDGSTWQDLRALRGLPSAFQPETPVVYGHYDLGLAAGPDGTRVWANPTDSGPQKRESGATWANDEGEWHVQLLEPYPLPLWP
ncbi:MAG: hypothetical protein L0Y66_27275, partial [Myxococcaceae bacterium]|nr:hypothetical protein [Myxococcaceae bacterium]